MFEYPNLKHIMDVPEIIITDKEKETNDLTDAEILEKLEAAVVKAASGRVKEIDKIKRENLKYRFELLQRAESDKELQIVIMEMCSRSPLFFINMFAWTYDPRLRSPHLPFITYPYQDGFISELTQAVEKGYDIRLEKSRDMGFTRCMLVFTLWGYLFRGRSSLLGSYKENYVHDKGNMDTHFERINYMLTRLPIRMRGDSLFKYMSISTKAGGRDKEIAGDSGQMFGTGGRRKFAFLDEFQAWQFDQTALRKTKDVTKCRIFGGTPEGTMNVYGKVMTDHKRYKNMLKVKLRLKRSEHPLKTKMWYYLQSLKRTEMDLAKEIDISYDNSVSGSVYPHFNDQTKIDLYPYNPQLKLYTSWDFGLDMNSLIFRQKDFANNALYIPFAIQKHDWEIEKFAAFAIGIPSSGYNYTRQELEDIEKVRKWRRSSGDFGDPYNSDNRSVIDKKNTIRTLLGGKGVHLRTNRGNTVEGRIRLAKLSMSRIHIDRDQFEFIEAIRQSHYPQRRENSQSTSDTRKPVHDENSHFRTAFEYFLDNEPSNPSLTAQATTVDYSDYLG